MSEPTMDRKPNILMIMVDQMRFPRFGYGAEHGFVDPLKKILGFQGDAHDMNEYRQYFPGFWALRDNAVVLRNHRIASSACVPSRTALFTGQYGTRTGVLQTDGVFKEGADRDYCWLRKGSFPTLGNWMRAAGYSSHYFGKWHITGEKTTSLEPFGFADWELSYPDPHGTLPNNLGHYRDYQFADLISSFLNRQGVGVPYAMAAAHANTTWRPDDGPSPEDTPTPWFAVASFTNPHDIAAYPGLPRYVHNSCVGEEAYTLGVPPQGAYANLPFGGTKALRLNRKGIPQNNANVSATWAEPLSVSNKPDCQLDYRYKMGLALVAKSGRLAAEKAQENLQEHFDPAATIEPELDRQSQWERMLKYAVNFTLDTEATGLPFALTADPQAASRAFMQYYGYLFSEVDQHIYRTLKTLEESGQAENTIVVFCPDHGEYGGAHGNLMEKWHSAYDEVIHVPVVVRFPSSMHHVAGGLRQISEITSHMDLLPTIMGLAGFDEARQKEIRRSLRNTGDFENVLPPVGQDLTSLIRGETKKLRRKGVLFITHDTITEPLETPELPAGQAVLRDGVTPADMRGLSKELTNYQVYLTAVEKLKADVDQGTSGLPDEVQQEITQMRHGPVCQPNNVHAYVGRCGWKLVCYFDPAKKVWGKPWPYEQFELYDLNSDPTESLNLLVYNEAFPTVIDERASEESRISRKANKLMKRLRKQDLKVLSWKEESETD